MDFMEMITILENAGSFDAVAFPLWLEDHEIDFEDEKAVGHAWDAYDGFVALSGPEYWRRDIDALRASWLRPWDFPG